MTLTVLVIGSGGREHALALALARDPMVEAVHVGPGNPGTWELSQAYGLDPSGDLWRRLTTLEQLDGLAVADLAKALGANLVVIGPEAPLIAGVADTVRAAGVVCFGPSAEAAQLEGSKQFAKQVMAAASVPTARSRYCRTSAEIEAALDEFGPPYVVKNDGLAGGKGVLVTDDRGAARAHAIACGVTVIEEYLDGPEVSLFAICDGRHGVPLLPAQDFKRLSDGDLGPNTGGMGSYAPLPWAPADLVDVIMSRVISPTLAAMADRGAPFQGLLYAGLALTSRGLRVVEFNARFGDPETEVILPLLVSPLGQLLYAAATGDLTRFAADPDVLDHGLKWLDRVGVAVVESAVGYPGAPRQGGSIIASPPPAGVELIHCGTALGPSGGLVAHGGRVLTVVATGTDLSQARLSAYAYLERLDFPDGFHRHDIAEKAAVGAIAVPAKIITSLVDEVVGEKE